MKSNGKPSRLKRDLVIFGAAVLLAATGILCYISVSIARNEEEAIKILATIARHQNHVAGTDYDNTGVQDFWVADVAGLYEPVKLRSPYEKQTFNRKWRYIDLETAKADACPLEKDGESCPTWGYGTIMPKDQWQPRKGYMFLSMKESADGYLYLLDTTPSDGWVNPYNNTTRFAFCAFPSSAGYTGTRTLIVSQDMNVYAKDIGGEPVSLWPAGKPENDGWVLVRNVHDMFPSSIVYRQCAECGCLHDGLYPATEESFYKTIMSDGCRHQWVEIPRQAFEEKCQMLRADWGGACVLFNLALHPLTGAADKHGRIVEGVAYPDISDNAAVAEYIPPKAEDITAWLMPTKGGLVAAFTIEESAFTAWLDGKNLKAKAIQWPDVGGISERGYPRDCIKIEDGWLYRSWELVKSPYSTRGRFSYAFDRKKQRGYFTRELYREN